MGARQRSDSPSLFNGTDQPVSITSLAFNGYGVGRCGGKVIFVPFTAPGDEVECRIVRTKQNCYFGEVIHLLKASPERREPPCPAFGACGGCHWQHLPYCRQTQWKERIFRDMLQRQGQVPDAVFGALVSSPSEFNYRSRAQFKCRNTDQGLVMGFYRRGSHFVIDIPECPLMAPQINETFKQFRDWLKNSPFASRIPQIDISVDDHQKVRAVIHHLGKIERALADALRPEAEKSGLSLFFQSGRNSTLRKICGSDQLHLFPLGPEGGLTLDFGPGSFSQVNLGQNRRLIGEIIESARLTGREKILDLFCGVGNLSLPLAHGAGQIFGVENYPPAVAQAKINALKNGFENVAFQAGCAEAFIREAGSKGEKFDLAILDPPREGAYRTIKELPRLNIPRIIYVSCDPATLTRDLVHLIHHGYRVLKTRVYDFFPQTFHIESLTLFEKT